MFPSIQNYPSLKFMLPAVAAATSVQVTVVTGTLCTLLTHDLSGIVKFLDYTYIEI